MTGLAGVRSSFSLSRLSGPALSGSMARLLMLIGACLNVLSLARPHTFDRIWGGQLDLSLAVMAHLQAYRT
jgi:hypothetical protein